MRHGAHMRFTTPHLHRNSTRHTQYGVLTSSYRTIPDKAPSAAGNGTRLRVLRVTGERIVGAASLSTLCPEYKANSLNLPSLLDKPQRVQHFIRSSRSQLIGAQRHLDDTGARPHRPACERKQ